MTGRTQIGKPAVLRQVPDRRRVLTRATIEMWGRVACGVCLLARPERSHRPGRSAPRLFRGWRCLLHLNAGFGPLTVRG